MKLFYKVIFFCFVPLSITNVSCLPIDNSYCCKRIRELEYKIIISFFKNQKISKQLFSKLFEIQLNNQFFLNKITQEYEKKSVQCADALQTCTEQSAEINSRLLNWSNYADSIINLVEKGKILSKKVIEKMNDLLSEERVDYVRWERDLNGICER